MFNSAEKFALLRIPGMGAASVKKVLQLRRHQRIRVQDLKKLGVVWKRARYFVKTFDSNDAIKQLDSQSFRQLFLPKPIQLNLFET